MQFYLCKTKWWPAGSFPQALPQGSWFAFNQQKSNLKFYNKIDFSISKWIAWNEENKNYQYFNAKIEMPSLNQVRNAEKWPNPYSIHPKWKFKFSNTNANSN